MTASNQTTHNSATETFDIRNFADQLTPTKNKNRYLCPACGGNNLTIDPKTGKYKCWNECECKEIREVISPWDEVSSSRQQQHSQRPKTKPKSKSKPKPKEPTPAPIPDSDYSLARLPNPVESPARVKKGNSVEITYPYSDTQWVLRTEKQDGSKVTIPYHINANGEAINKKGDNLWLPYRMDEVIAFGSGKWILGNEGEKCVEASRQLRLVSFTFQGAGWDEASLIQSMQAIKDAGVTGVVYFPDNDDTGLEKGLKLARAANIVGLPFIQINPVRLWAECPDSGDIADWVELDMNTEEFIRRLEAEIHSCAEERRQVVNDTLNQTLELESSHKTTKLEANLNTIRSVWGSRLRWNTLKKQAELDNIRLPMDRIKTRIAKEIHIDLTREDAKELVLELAHEYEYNPVVDYLELTLAKHQDVDTSILDRLALNFLGTNDVLHAALLKRTLIAAVARAFEPGCKHDAICILQGEQGSFKSTFWSTLASDNWFTDDISSGTEKDEILKLSQYWIMEYAEFESAYRKKEVSTLKAFLARKTDSVRRPYGTDIEDVPRPSIFVGTTNKSEFLHDPTGERRYWVIRVLVKAIDIARLKAERDLIWAAAVKLYKQGEQWWVTRHEDELLKIANGQYQTADSWETPIETYLANRSFVVVGDILHEVLKLELAKQDRASEMRVAEILRRLGWQKCPKQRRINGNPRWVWEPIALSQPSQKTGGCDGVVTEVMTPSSPVSTGTSDIASQPSQPFSRKVPEQCNANVGDDGDDGGSSAPEVAEKDMTGGDSLELEPVTESQQGMSGVITSVTTPVTTCVTTSEKLDDELILGNVGNIIEAIALMDGEVLEALTENWSAELKLSVSTSLSTEDRAAVLALAPGALPQPPEKLTRINVEHLPLPSCEEMKLQTKVWVFRVKDKEWFPGLVSEIETDIWDELPNVWVVKTTCGQKIKARCLEKLRLRT